MPIKSVQKKAEPPSSVIDPAHELPAPRETVKADPKAVQQKPSHTNMSIVALVSIVVLILLFALLAWSLA